MYGIEVYTPYVIHEGTVATYGFVSPTNHKMKTIMVRREEIFTELGKSIWSPSFVFNGRYKRNIVEGFTHISKAAPV